MSTEPTGMKAPMILSTSLFEFPRVSLEVRGYVFSIFGFCLFVSPPHTWQCILQCVPFNVCVGGGGIAYRSYPRCSAHQAECPLQTMAPENKPGWAVLVLGLDSSGSLLWNGPPSGSDDTGPKLLWLCKALCSTPLHLGRRRTNGSQ